MTNNNLKNIVIYQDSLFGTYTISDLINYIKDINKEYKNMEQIILNILEATKLSDKDISSIFTPNIEQQLNFVIDVLEENI